MWALVVALTLSNSIRAAAPISWESRGIGAGGGMYCPAISPLDSKVMFLGVDMSEMLRTTNGGALWTTVDFTQLQARQISEVQFTATSRVLYSVDVHRLADETSAPRPVKSTNQGDTWTTFSQWPPTPNQRANTVWANPNRDDTFVVCTGNNLYFYRNTNTTAAFSLAWSFSSAQGRVGGAFWRGNEVWLGTSEGLLYSTNGGQTFSASVSPGVSRIASFAGGHDSTNDVLRFLAVTTLYNLSATDPPDRYSNAISNRVWRLDWSSASKTWVEVMAGIPPADHVQLAGMARNNPYVVYVAATRTGSYPDNCAVWRMNNGETNWQSIFLIPGNSNIVTGWGSINNRASTGSRQFETKLTYHAPCGFAVDPANANRTILCDNALIHMSTNAASGNPIWQQMYCEADNPGHEPGQLFPPGQSYAGKGLEATVWMDLVWTSRTSIFAAALDISPPVSSDGGKRWGFPYESTTLGIGDPNAIVYDAVSNRLYVTCANTVSPYEYLGSDDANTDLPLPLGKNPPGVYYQTPGQLDWLPLKTDFGVGAGQPGASPTWLTLDNVNRRLFVSIVSSNASKDGIYVMDLNTTAWNKLPAPTRTDASNHTVTVQHPFVVRVLPDGGLVATYCAHQIGDASLFNVGTNGYYKPTSGVFHLAPGASNWVDRTKAEMRYFTRDIIIDPSDTNGLTWFATVSNTDVTGVIPADPFALPRTWGGLYRTTNGGVNWTRIWAGDANFSGSVTTATLNPEAALNDEMFISTRFSGVWVSTNVHAASPIFTRVTNYPFRAPERVIFNPYDSDEIWVMSNGNGPVVGIRPTSFAEWQQRQFGSQAGVPEIAGAQADPDGDGFSNLWEYALKTRPATPNGNAVSYSRNSATGLLTISFQRYLAASDVTWTIDGSMDLSNWQPLAQASGQGVWNSFTGNMVQSPEGLVSYTDAISSTTGSARFIRVRAMVP